MKMCPGYRKPVEIYRQIEDNHGTNTKNIVPKKIDSDSDVSNFFSTMGRKIDSEFKQEIESALKAFTQDLDGLFSSDDRKIIFKFPKNDLDNKFDFLEKQDPEHSTNRKIPGKVCGRVEKV